jgi:transcriptional regulator with GAF, ATPase, and Fis domain
VAKPVADWEGEVDDLDLKNLDERSSTPPGRGKNKNKAGHKSTGTNVSGQPYRQIVGMSSSFTAARHMLERVAPTNATTLLVGESGVGKELFARTLHQLSLRRDNTFLAVNCAAIPDSLMESELFGADKGAFTGATNTRQGRFERASGGTLFLDEIASLSLVAQGKLLRVVQEGELERVGGNRVIPVDVRLVAATNIDLREEVKAGRFREDLFFRLNVFPIELPPLRKRRDDIPLLMEHFLTLYSNQHGRSIKGFTHRATDTLLHYDYPGNLRELQNLIERGVISSEDDGLIDSNHMFRAGESVAGAAYSLDMGGSLVKSERARSEQAQRAEPGQVPVTGKLSSSATLDDHEREIFADVLEKTAGNVSAAARSLGISRARLDYRLRKLGLLPAWGKSR